MKLLIASLLGVAYSDCPGYCADVDLDGNPNDCSNRGNINAEIFLNYGDAAGDAMGPWGDDRYAGPITFSQSVTFFGNQYNDFYWSTNGLMTFGSGFDSYDSDPFPINDVTLFSPFWTDLRPSSSEDDIGGERDKGLIYARELTAGLEAASDMIRYEMDYPGFQADQGAVVTWKDIRFFGQDNLDRKNTFQAILLSNSDNDTFVIFNYGDIEYTAVEDDCRGLVVSEDGVAAQVGFNDGEGNFYNHPLGRINDVIRINQDTNVKTIGRYVYKISSATISDDPPKAPERFPGLLDGPMPDMGRIRIANTENSCIIINSKEAKKSQRQVRLNVEAGECTESENALWYVTENDQLSSVLFPDACMQMSKDRKMIELDECKVGKKQRVDYMDGRLHLGSRCVFAMNKKDFTDQKLAMRLVKCGYSLFGENVNFGQEFGEDSSDEESE